MLTQLKKHSIRHGMFDLPPETNISSVVREHEVPNSYGVYLIFKGDQCKGKPIYIGKAGPLSRKGGWSSQGLAERLSARQRKIRRNRFFRELIKAQRLPSLSFAWFVTHDGNSGVLPALAEAQLMQKYLNKYGCLPGLNEEF